MRVTSPSQWIHAFCFNPPAVLCGASINLHEQPPASPIRYLSRACSRYVVSRVILRRRRRRGSAPPLPWRLLSLQEAHSRQRRHLHVQVRHASFHSVLSASPSFVGVIDFMRCRGGTPFCSRECRREQMDMDEALEKDRVASYSASPSASSTQQAFSAKRKPSLIMASSCARRTASGPTQRSLLSADGQTPPCFSN